MKKILSILALLTTFTLSGFETGCPGQFYLKAGSGCSFAQRPDVTAPSVVWDIAQEGYNGNLGSRPILAAGLGYQFSELFATDLTVSFRPQFRYRKFQTGIFDPITSGFLGNKTRQFDLDVSTLMWSLYFLGNNVESLTWSPGFVSGKIYPIVGGGVGYSRLKVYNFRSTGLPIVDPTSPNPGFGSDNLYTIRNRFTYQVMAGVEYQVDEKWAISTGYRWFDAGRYKGPSFIRRPNGVAIDISGNEWDMRFAAHEVFLELKVFL